MKYKYDVQVTNLVYAVQKGYKTIFTIFTGLTLLFS